MKSCLMLFAFLYSIFSPSLCRELPRSYIDTAIQIFKDRKGTTIVELGSMAKMDHDIDSGGCIWCMSGHSTILWARTLVQVYSVDIDPVASAVAREACRGYPNVKVVTADGIEFLRTFSSKIDLLYLDAWDVYPGIPFAEKHLEAYEAAKDKLSEKAMVLIDDTDIEDGGKGRLIVPQAIKDGFKVIFTGRQTLLAKADRINDEL